MLPLLAMTECTRDEQRREGEHSIAYTSHSISCYTLYSITRYSIYFTLLHTPTSLYYSQSRHGVYILPRQLVVLAAEASVRADASVAWNGRVHVVRAEEGDTQYLHSTPHFTLFYCILHIMLYTVHYTLHYALLYSILYSTDIPRGSGNRPGRQAW
jgi:hypothetical protein